MIKIRTKHSTAISFPTKEYIHSLSLGNNTEPCINAPTPSPVSLHDGQSFYGEILLT